MTTIKIGADGIVSGPLGAKIADQARRAERAGFASIWLGDHIVSPLASRSRYPYSSDGSIPWTPETATYDVIVSAAIAAASTEHLDVALGVLVLPLREPLIVAKQLATLEQLSDGRLILGCGAGWLAEEFVALNVPFQSRHQRLREWITLLRLCWTGHPGLVSGDNYKLSVETACYPVPSRPVPILIGGTSDASMELVGRHGDGWYPIVTADQLNREWLQPRIARIVQGAADAGRDPTRLRFAIYADAPLEAIAQVMPDLEDIGVSDVVVFVDWQDDGAPEATMTALRQ